MKSKLETVKKSVPEYHQSAINMFLKCGKQWFFRYHDKIYTPPSAALTVGRSVDIAVNRNLVTKAQSGQAAPLEECLDTYSREFEREAQETAWGEDDRGKQKDIGVGCLTVHHKELAPLVNPATVQEKFVLETNAGYNVGGIIDYTTVEGYVHDAKTSKNRYPEDAVFRNLQATMYDFAFKAMRKKKAKGFQFDVMIKPTKTLPARAQIVKGKIKKADHVWLFDTINSVHASIQAGIAPPAPEGAWWCSQKWCGYWSICKGKK